MATLIKLRRNFTAAAAPATLTEGELAVNPTDRKLFVGPSGGGGPIDLSPSATASLEGRIRQATTAEVRSCATGNLAVTAGSIEAAAAAVALTDAATIAVDWDAFINSTVTLAGNRSLGNPTNGQPGTWRRLQLTQDATGIRTLAYGNQYQHPGGVEPVLSTTANAVDTLYIYCRTTSIFEVHVGGLGWAV